MAAATISFVGLGAGETLTELRHLAAAPNPYFVSDEALTLYVLLPLYGFAAASLILFPGLFFALAFARPTTGFVPWLARGFFLSIVCLPALTATARHLIGRPFTGTEFWLMCVLFGSAGLLLLSARLQPHHSVFLKRRGPEILAIVATPLLALLLINAKFYFEALNSDGAHDFLNVINYIQRGVVFWPPGPDEFGGHPAPSSYLPVLPASAFVFLLGQHPFAVRCTFLLGIGILAGVIVALARNEDRQRDNWLVSLSVICSLLFFTYLAAFAFSYSTHFGNIISPGNREPILLLAFLSFTLAVQAKRTVGIFLFAYLCFAARPGGLLLMGFWLIAFGLVNWRFPLNLPWRAGILAGLAICVALILSSKLYAFLLDTGVTSSTLEMGTTGIAQRLRFVGFPGFERLGYWIVGAGILPMVALLLWPKQDQFSRTLTLTSLFYFLFFFAQAYRVLPHHFAPVMVLPLIVFWRTAPHLLGRPLLSISAIASVVLAFAISMPASFKPHLNIRTIGEGAAFGFEQSELLENDRLFAKLQLLRKTFRIHYKDELHQNLSVGGPSVIVHSWLVRREDQKDPLLEFVALDQEDTGSTHRLAEPAAGYVMVSKAPEKIKGYLVSRANPRSIPERFFVSRDDIFGYGERDWPRPVWDLKRVVHDLGLASLKDRLTQD